MIDKTAREQALKDARRFRRGPDRARADGAVLRPQRRGDRPLIEAPSPASRGMQRQPRRATSRTEAAAMIDLNHGSGCQYGAPAGLPDTTALIAGGDRRGADRPQPAQPPRPYVSTSGLGRACLRQIQYDYLAVPKDEGRDFEPARSHLRGRPPRRGHRRRLAAARRLRSAHERADGRQFGFSSLDGRFKGHIDGCLVAGPVPLAYPALWENKALGAHPGRTW